MQAGKITINRKVNIDFTLTGLSATETVKWNCHVDDSTKSRYHMILGIDILKSLVLNIKSSDNFIGENDGPFKVSTAPMVDMGMYEFLIFRIREN